MIGGLKLELGPGGWSFKTGGVVDAAEPLAAKSVAASSRTLGTSRVH